ncbi:hypothetical protein CYY_008413 [Polysphondylium violaceum]|uniref:Cns1/TTC4 wheel domain-containing protein n=1 Tax=Polysphondylium violaceum TaxID=133409 RepID=A0A8J4PPA4_9MYCE|nr:hypothetical protein CYY_008413 [Polysphondylium violaceum]
MDPHQLTEAEEDEIWEASVERWKNYKETKRLEREEALKQGVELPEEDDDEWKQLPMFMEALPNEPTSNVHLTALQSISDECTPEERADAFKEVGNDFFKAGKDRYKDAIYYYTKALNVKCKDMRLNSAILSNRAACNLELGNYRKVIQDCTIAIEFNKENIKAYHRAARAYFALNKDKEALDVCEKALTVDPQHKDIKTLSEKIQKRIQDRERREREKIEKENAKRQEIELLATKLYQRGIKLGSPLFDMAQYTHSSDRKIAFDSDNIIHFPVVFLYPEYSMSDFIIDFEQDHTFGDHLSMMFPPDNPEYAGWDKSRSYTIDKIEVYFETNWTKPILPNVPFKETKRWIRIKHTTTIEAVLKHPDYIIPGIPIFYIVARVLSLSFNKVSSQTCMSDALLTSTGVSKEVDWWFIIKIRGFSDVYYYYDSDMDKKNEANFKIGYFLRSKFSAFGATLLPYANLDGNGERITTLGTNFIAYNDHFYTIKSKDKSDRTPDNNFYNRGAHEKGLIGWSTNVAGKGLIIQHSLPNFPYGYERGMFQPVMNDNIKALNGEPGYKGQEIKMYFTMYGWKTNIFGPNLMPYHIPGRKFYVTPEEAKPNVNDHGTRLQTGALQRPNVIGYTTTSQYELFSLLFTTTVKPSQQIFCSSLVDEPMSTSKPGTKVKEMVQFMSDLSDVGLYAGKFNEIEESFIEKGPGGKVTQHVSYPGKLKFKTRPSSNKPVFSEKEIKVGEYNYYMRINHQSDEANSGQGKVDDIWKSLIDSRKEPNLAITDQDTSQLNNLAISTWAYSNKDSWWKGKIVSPVFKINAHDNTFRWKGNSNQEHSKIAFRTKEIDSDQWNVCSSGGNLYYTGKDKIKSSLLICFKAKGLRQAFQNIMTNDGGKEDDKDTEISKDDGEHDEDEVDVQKPDKFTQKQSFIESLKIGKFKYGLSANVAHAKQISQEMDALKTTTRHFFNYNPSKQPDYTNVDINPDGSIPRRSPRLLGIDAEIVYLFHQPSRTDLLQDKIDLTVPSDIFYTMNPRKKEK